jgi:hypothetical protein
MGTEMMKLRDGEELHAFALRVGWRMDSESFEAFLARVGGRASPARSDSAEVSVLRADAGDDDDEDDEDETPSAEEAQRAMTEKKLYGWKNGHRVAADAPPVDGDGEPLPNAAAAQKAMIQRKTTGWEKDRAPAKARRDAPSPAAAPKPAPEAPAGELPSAEQSYQAMLDRKYGRAVRKASKGPNQ